MTKKKDRKQISIVYLPQSDSFRLTLDIIEYDFPRKTFFELLRSMFNIASRFTSSDEENLLIKQVEEIFQKMEGQEGK